MAVKMTKTLLVMMNTLSLILSLVMLGAGASLMGFYRIQMLEVINGDYFIVPIVLTVGGVLTLIVAVCGMMAAIRDGPKLLIAYSVLLALSIIISIGCIGCCVLLLFDIQAGFLSFHAVHEELSTYSSDSSVQQAGGL